MDLTDKDDLDKALKLSCNSLNGSSITIEKARPKQPNSTLPKHQPPKKDKDKIPRNSEDWTFGGDDSKDLALICLLSVTLFMIMCDFTVLSKFDLMM